MVHTTKHIVTKDFIGSIENADEILAREVIMTLVRDMPLEDLKKLFNYHVFDPNSSSSQEALKDWRTDQELKQRILRMREEHILELSAYIEL